MSPGRTAVATPTRTRPGSVVFPRKTGRRPAEAERHRFAFLPWQIADVELRHPRKEGSPGGAVVVERPHTLLEAPPDYRQRRRGRGDVCPPARATGGSACAAPGFESQNGILCELHAPPARRRHPSGPSPRPTRWAGARREGLHTGYRHYDMPVTDGATMLQHLRKDPNIRSIPLIMLTAESSSQIISTVARLGVRDYIVTPFQEGPLLPNAGRIVSLVPARRSPIRVPPHELTFLWRKHPLF